jgi:hypothetical protein
MGIRGARVAAIGIMTLSMVCAACSSHGTTSSSSASPTGAQQPSVANGRFTNALLDKIPRYPGAKALSPPSETNGVIVQSFSTHNTTPQTILRWYASTLTGWKMVTEPHATGPTDWRGEWVQGGTHLLISAAPSPTASTSNAAVGSAGAQYSVELSADAPPSE